MPTVGRYQRRETLGALPSGMKRAAATALSEGAGVEEAKADKLRAFSETAGVVGRIGLSVYEQITERERNKANQTALLEADNQLAEWENSYLHGDQGVLRLKGKAAMDAPKATREAFDKRAGEIEAGLSNDEQRAAFARARSQRYQAIDLQVQRHTGQQVDAYTGEQLQAKVILGTDEAIRLGQTDPKLAAAKLGEVESAIDTVGISLGWSKEKAETAKATQRSKVHGEIMNGLLAAGKDQEAKSYWEAAKGQIDPTEHDSFIAKLKDVGDLAAAQKLSDKIILEGGTLTDQRNKAKAIADPEQRDKALQLIEHEHAVRDKVRLDAERKSLQGLYNSIDAGNTNLARIIRSPEFQSIEDLGVRNQIRKYVQDRIEGVPQKTDIVTKLELYTMLRDKPAEFQRLNLLTFRTKLSDADLEQMAGYQVGLARGETKQAAADVSGLLTTEAILRATMGDRYDPEKKETQQMLISLNAKYEEHQLRNKGEKMTDTELQQTADFLYQDVVLREGTWLGGLPARIPTPFNWGSVSIPVPGGGGTFSDVTKPVRDLTISDIPEREQLAAAASLRSAGQVPTPDAILREWVRGKRRMGQVRTPK